jgi:hypothetical protein
VETDSPPRGDVVARRTFDMFIPFGLGGEALNL